MISKKLFLTIFIEFLLLKSVNSCAGGIGGGGILTNPSFSMKFHPPTAWTYPDANALTTLAYFPGQSMTQTDAQLRANGDLTSAVLAALSALQLPTMGVTITPSYTPPVVNDCVKATTGATPTAEGAQVGFEEGGVITRLITAGTGGITVQNCVARNYAGTGTTPLISTPFIQQATVKVDGITISEYQATLLAAKMSSYLQLNSKVDFTEEMTVN